MSTPYPVDDAAKPVDVLATLSTSRVVPVHVATVRALDGDIALAAFLQQLRYRLTDDRRCQIWTDEAGAEWVDATRSEMARDLGISEDQAKRLMVKARDLGVVETCQPFKRKNDRRLFARIRPIVEATSPPTAGAESPSYPEADSAPLPPLEPKKRPNKEVAAQRAGSDPGREVVVTKGDAVDSAREPDRARELVTAAWAARTRDGKPRPTVRQGNAFMALTTMVRKLLDEGGHEPELIGLALYDHDSAWTNDAFLVTLGKMKQGRAADPRLAAAMRDRNVMAEVERLRALDEED